MCLNKYKIMTCNFTHASNNLYILYVSYYIKQSVNSFIKRSFFNKTLIWNKFQKKKINNEIQSFTFNIFGKKVKRCTKKNFPATSVSCPPLSSLVGDKIAWLTFGHLTNDKYTPVKSQPATGGFLKLPHMMPTAN